MHSSGVGSGYMKQFLITPNKEKHFFSGKLIRIAAKDPPTVIINDGTLMNGVRLPLTRIEPTTRPVPISKPIIVAISTVDRSCSESVNS
jgi:hypothetical protein